MSSEIKADKWSPATGTSATLGDSGDTFTIPSGATLTNSGTATGFGITEANFRPNAQSLIINGSMQAAQRGTSTSSITSSDYYTCDRWKTTIYTAGTWTQTQETLSTADLNTTGQKNSLKMDCTTADASPAAGDALHLQTRLEAQDCQLFKYGTASAEKLTLSFWVKATKTGTNIVEAYQFDDDRICCLSYTVSSTDTWEQKILNFPVDAPGVIDDNTGPGISFGFYMAAGSDYTSGTLQTTWAARTDANRAVGQVNNADSTSNNFEITGVQLEIGEFTTAGALPPFQHDTYAANIKRCERYYQLFPSTTTSAYIVAGNGFAYGSGNVYLNWPHRTTMRGDPSFDKSGTWKIFYSAAGQNGTPVLAADYSGADNTTVQMTDVTGMTAGVGIVLQQSADGGARMKLDAEL